MGAKPPLVLQCGAPLPGVPPALPHLLTLVCTDLTAEWRGRSGGALGPAGLGRDCALTVHCFYVSLAVPFVTTGICLPFLH